MMLKRLFFIPLLFIAIGAQANPLMLAGAGMDAGSATCDDPGVITSDLQVLIQSNNPAGSQIFKDESPYAHAVATSGASANTSHQTAKTLTGASAIDFDGTTDSLDISDAGWDFGYQQDWSINLWLNIDSDSADFGIVSRDRAGGDFWSFYYVASLNSLFFYNGSSGSINRGCFDGDSRSLNVADGWVMATLTSEAGYIHIYQDGTLCYDSQTNPPTAKDTTTYMAGRGPLQIGAHSTSSAYFNGQMENIAIYKGKALSQVEITALYNSGTPEPYSSTCYELGGCTGRLPFSVSAHSAGDDLAITTTNGDFMSWACGTHDTDDLRQNVFITQNNGYTGELYEAADGNIDCTGTNDADYEFDASTTATAYYLYYDCPFNSEWHTTLTGGATTESFSTPDTPATPLFQKVSSGDMYDSQLETLTGWTGADSGSGISQSAPFRGFETLDLYGGTGSADYARRYQDLGSFSTRTVFSMRAYFDILGTKAADNHFEASVRSNGELYAFIIGSDGFYHFVGGAYTLISGISITQDTWQEWTFDIDWSANTVDIYRDGILIKDDEAWAWTTGVTDGQVWMTQHAWTIETQSYIDFIKIGTTFLNE